MREVFLKMKKTKFTKFMAIVLSVLLSGIITAGVVVADNLWTDTDLVASGNQQIVNLGIVAPGFAFSDTVRIYAEKTGGNNPAYPLTVVFNPGSTGISGDGGRVTNSGIGNGFDATIRGNAPMTPGQFTFVVKWTCDTARLNDANATMTYTGIVGDNVPPTIVAPADLTVEANAVLSLVNLGTPVVSDNMTPVNEIIVTNNAPAAFPLGETTVTWTARDAFSNTNTATQKVAVVDTTKPVFTSVPADKVVEATAVQTPVSAIGLGAATATDIFEVTITNNAPSTFPIGPTTVIWTATDANGNSRTAEQVITVVDTTNPEFTFVPEDKVVEATAVETPLEDIGLVAAEAYDIFPVTITNNAPTAFPLGNTPVVWTAKDSNNRVSTETQVITVVDTTRPDFTFVPVNKVVEATAVQTPISAINLGMATATDIFPVAITNNAPSTFPIGVTTVVWTAADANGNFRTAEQVITVVDTTKPVFTFVPVNKTVHATAAQTPLAAINLGMATATDIFPVAITNNAPATFPIGNTTVVWTATDANGNYRTATQVITVKYEFSGLLRPIDAIKVNSVKAGSSVPVKFSLGGYMGMSNDIFSMAPICIDIGSAIPSNEEQSNVATVTAGNSGLSYDSTAKEYTYVWKTDKKWTGNKNLVFRLKDGTLVEAKFTFK